MKICKQLIFVYSLLIFFCSITFGEKKNINVVPEPKLFNFTEDSFAHRDQAIQLKYFDKASEQVENAIADLINEALQHNGTSISLNITSAQKIYIGIPSANKEFTQIVEDNFLMSDSLGDEGYNLLIDSDKIVIAAYTQKGLFYGIQSLKQMIRANKDNESLPGVIIKDWPSFKYRAIMDDISRGPIPTLDYMKYQIKRLAEMKINTILHYVEHVVKTESHTEFAPEDGSLTIEEWKEISDYALRYNITIIGGFQSFGHFQNILSTPEYAHLGESGSLISPVLPESYEFLENIYREMIPAFTTEFFNINCDETFDLGKGASKKLVDSLGYAEVYYLHIKRLYDILKKYDKRVIMWGDILMQYPEILKKLPKDILIGTWDYDARDTFEKFIDPFRDSGHELRVVPGVLNTRSIYPDFNKAFGNIKTFIEEGYEAGASGVMNCFWDDGGTGLFSNDWYGAAYGADKSWNHESNDLNFDMRYARGSLAAKNDNFLKAIKKVNELRFLELTDGMKDRFLFTKIIPDQGKDIKISTAGLKDAVNIINKADSLLKAAQLLNYSDDKTYLEFVINLYRTLAYERFELLEAAENYRQAEEFLTTSPFDARKHILSSLEKIVLIIENQNKIKQIFEILWLKENHTYALEWITDKYEAKINDFIEIKDLLKESLKKFDSSKPIIPIKDVRLSIIKLPGKYFTEWMMINPLPNVDNLPLSSIDYLVDMGGESSSVPKVTQEFYFDDNKYRWRRVISQQQDIVNLNDVFPGTDNGAVMYAFANVTVGENKMIKALVGFSEGIEVFINGESQFKESGGKLKPDKEAFMLSLPKGKNNLMLKITKLNNDWGFSFRLPDSKVRNSKNRYRIIN